MHMKNKKKKNRPEPSFVGAVSSAPMGALIFLAASLITSLPASLLAYSTADPGKYVFPFGLAALYLSAAAGGFASFKRHRGLALATGFFCGLACVAVSLLLSLLIPAQYSPDVSPAVLFLTRLPIILMTVLGSFIASAKPRKKRKRR